VTLRTPRWTIFHLMSVDSGEPGASERREKAPITARLVLQESLTARRAAAIIALATLMITIAGGILMRVLDHREYSTIGRGLWFSLQTVTTVGYGDVTPEHSSGRFIAAVVMLAGLGFIAVITAAVTASLVESARKRANADSDREAQDQLAQISARLAAIEEKLDRQASG
jgi:voltage-gated potassium channel Kch